MDKILAQVVALENRGYQFEAAEASFDLLVKKTAGQFTPHFELLNFHVNVEADRDGAATTEATVKLRIGEAVHVRALPSVSGQLLLFNVDLQTCRGYQLFPNAYASGAGVGADTAAMRRCVSRA